MSLTMQFGPSSSSWIDTSDPFYAVKGDGAKDNTGPINAAIGDAATQGGGIVALPAGTVIADGLSMKTRVHLRGVGAGATTLKLKAGSTNNVIQTANFATLSTEADWPTFKPGVPYQFAVSHMAIDGNRANCPSGKRGLAICGFEYRMTDLLIHDCQTDGFYSEYNTGTWDTSIVGVDGVESFVSRCKTRNNGRNGVWHMGPYDSMYDHVNSSSNGGGNAYGGFKVDGGGAMFTNCHSWGNQYDAWWLRGHCMLTTCVAEGGHHADFNVEWHDVRIVGGEAYYAGDSVAAAVLLGRPGNPVNNIHITGLSIFNGGAPDDFAPAIDMKNLGTGCSIDADIAQASGVGVAGAAPADSYLNIRVTGGASGAVFKLPANAQAVT